MSGGRQPALTSEPFETAIREAQAEIARSVDKGGLRDDPMRYPLAALSTVVGLFPDFLRSMREAAGDARQPLDAAAVDRLEKAAAKGASRASAELVQSHNRRSVLVGSLAVAAAVSAGVGGGFVWGRADATTQFRIADAGFAAVIHYNPVAGTGWLELARLNDYGALMAACHGESGFTDASGRHACMAPLWLDEAAPASAPKPASIAPTRNASQR